MVTTEQLRDKMRDVLESVRGEGAIRLPPDAEPFLVLNPGYHDGKRASFLFVPASFCESMLYGPNGISRRDVSSAPAGRLLTVTDRGIVLTARTSSQMVHLTCDVTAEFRDLGSGDTTMGSLDDAARGAGWLVPWSDFDVVMAEIARQNEVATRHVQLLKLPEGVVAGKGGGVS